MIVFGLGILRVDIHFMRSMQMTRTILLEEAPTIKNYRCSQGYVPRQLDRIRFRNF